MPPRSVLPYRRPIAIVALLCLLPSCFLDGAGRAGDLADAAATRDASTPLDAGTEDAGACVPAPESCDGRDEDCDGATDEALSQPCESACGPGTAACVGGAWECGAPTPVDEACNGLDDDCDDSIDEALARGCETACGPGTERCSGGAWGRCVPDTPGTERCDGTDEDCDGTIDEDLSQPCSTACGSGVEQCVDGGWMGCTAPPVATEVCDGRDQDCDAIIDEVAGCPCSIEHQGGHAYLFCTTGATWPDAQAFCAPLGYDLVTIGGAAENGWVAEQALNRVEGEWWIGLHDRTTPNTFEWVSGSTETFRYWHETQPNDAGGTQECVTLDDGSNADYEARGAWGDRDCDPVLPFVCESRP